MASHKRRVQRKIKKDVKKKVQASRAKQQANQSQLEQVMKLMGLVKGVNGSNTSTDQATLLRLRDENAKANQETARLKRENELKRAQSKVDEANNDAKHQQRMNEMNEQYLAEVRKLNELEREGKEREAKEKQEQILAEKRSQLKRLGYTGDELEQNSRAKSAKLRIAEKI